MPMISLVARCAVCLCFAAAAAAPLSAADATPVLSLPLRGNPSTGFFWSWTADGDGAVAETDVAYRQDENVPGSPATYVYSFVGEKEGKVALRFVYSRSDEEQPGDRVNSYQLEVLPDKRIVLLDMREDIEGNPQPRW